MIGATSLVSNGVIAYRGLFPWVTKRLIIPTLVLTPCMQILAFTWICSYLGTEPTSFYAIGNSMQIVGRVSVFGACVAIGAERMLGSLGVVVAAPRSSAATFLGRIPPVALTGFVSGILGLFACTAATGVNIPLATWPIVAVMILLVATSCSAFGLALGAFALHIRDVFFLPNLAVYCMMALCGVDFTAGQLPQWAETVGNALPMTHGLEAIRQLLSTKRIEVNEALLELAVLLAYTLLACLLMMAFEWRARHTASIDFAA